MGIIMGIVSAAVTVTEALAAAKLAVEGLKMLCGALMCVAKAMGLLQPENRVDELGDKALQAEEVGITPEKFDTYAEYVRQVEAFEVDPKKTAMYTDTQKILKGTELTAGVMLEEFPDLPVEQFFTYAGKNPEYFTEARMEALGAQLKEEPALLSNVLGYLDGSEKNDLKLDRTMTALIEIEKKIDPEISDSDALKKVLDAGGMD